MFIQMFFFFFFPPRFRCTDSLLTFELFLWPCSGSHHHVALFLVLTFSGLVLSSDFKSCWTFHQSHFSQSFGWVTVGGWEVSLSAVAILNSPSHFLKQHWRFETSWTVANNAFNEVCFKQWAAFGRGEQQCVYTDQVSVVQSVQPSF